MNVSNIVVVISKFTLHCLVWNNVDGLCKYLSFTNLLFHKLVSRLLQDMGGRRVLFLVPVYSSCQASAVHSAPASGSSIPLWARSTQQPAASSGTCSGAFKMSSNVWKLPVDGYFQNLLGWLSNLVLPVRYLLNSWLQHPFVSFWHNHQSKSSCRWLFPLLPQIIH